MMLQLVKMKNQVLVYQSVQWIIYFLRLQSNGCKVVACLQRQENPGLFAGSIPMASVEHYQFCAEEVKSLTILPKVLFFAALEYIELGICISGYGSSQSCKICLVVSAMDSIQLNMILSSL